MRAFRSVLIEDHAATRVAHRRGHLPHEDHPEEPGAGAADSSLTAEEFFELDGSGTMTTKVDWQRILRDEPPRIAVEPEAASAPIALNPGDTVRVVGTTAVAVTQRQGATTGQHVRTVGVLVKGAGRWRLLFATSQVTD